MKMKKVLATGMSLLMAGSMIACSSQEETASPSASAATGSGGGAAAGAPTKLTYWTVDRHDTDYIKEVIAKFEQANPGTTVELKVMADNYAQSVDIAFSSKQAPDIFRVDAANVPTWEKKGYMAPLDTYMSAELKEKFKNLLIDEKNTVNGKIYTLPNIGQFWRLIYNVDLFEKAGIKEPPKTLDEMVAAAKKITEVGKADGAYGFAGNFKGGGFTRVANPVSSLSYKTGNEGFNFQTGKFDFGMYKAAAEALRQIKQDGSMLPGSESLDIDPLRAQFAQGKIGMYFNHSGEPGVYKFQFPTKIRWAGAMPPTVDGKQTGAVQVIAGSYLALSKESPNKEKAWKLIEMIYSDDVQTVYHEKGYGISVIPTVNAKAKAPDIPSVEGFLPTKADAIYPASPMVISEGRLEGVKMVDVFNKYIFSGGNLDQDIEDLNKRYNAALDKAKAAGDTKIAAKPDFDSSKLQGTLAK
jgi:multiple sugar transport system substrate-binding protein